MAETRKGPPDNRPRGVTILTVLIAAAWIGAMVIEAISPDWEAPASLDPLMLLVVGYYFTDTAIENKRKNDRKDRDEDDDEDKDRKS